MKILYITNRVPFPANGGYPIVVRNTLKGIKNLGAEIHCFCLNPNRHFVEPARIDDPVLNNISLTTNFLNTEVSRWKAVKNLLQNKSYIVRRYFNVDAAINLKNIITANHFDIIQLEGLFVVPYLPLIRQFCKTKVIYRAHNIEYQIWEGLADSEKSPFKKFYLNSLGKALKKFELSQLNKFDAVATICNADLRELQYQGCKVPMENFSVMIDASEYKPDPALSEPLSVFHLGSMDWLPNREGVEWFLENVWGDLKDLNVGLKFHIAGKNIPDEFKGHESDDVRIHENLGNAPKYMNSKSIMIVPLHSGSGMRVKIIEAMVMKKCVISTSMGAQGIRYQHGKNILIADTADDFYRYILQCSTDRAFVEMIGENARTLVEQEYNMDKVGRKIMGFYQKLTEA